MTAVGAAGTTTGVEVLDPRVDPEPRYWAKLREVAGLRADWSWPVLTTQAWLARTPQLVTVFLDGGEPRGVVWATWVTAGTRRHRFVTTRRGRLGFLEVRSPNCSAVPGWWFADYTPGERPGQLRELFGEYVTAMRRELGIGFRGMLLRQLQEAELPEVAGRFRRIRAIEPVGVLDTAGHRGDDDWLATLAKKRRWELRKITRSVAEDPAIAVRTRNGTDEEDLPELNRLLRHNSDKHQYVPIVPLPYFGPTLATLLRESDVHTVGYHDPETGRRLAAALVLDHPEWPVFRAWSALPVEEGGVRNLYLHVYGELTRWSIAAGKRGVVAGKGMSKLKASLGCRLVPQFAAAVPC